ncbi:MAG TPA: phosphoribosylanthranilate isomerase [Opitutaceae bacterium]|nr:phosphoribosylanthranilate isomerase [Opitutaceae bacterium]HRJ46871.1 phosphoribosylanthranilate isomerase [Opitutaceae bacterium]
MVAGIRIKLCGLTALVDAQVADQCGVDFLGFNFYPKSPRHLGLETYRAMARNLPDRRRVAVCVEPTAAELGAMQDAGLDFFQIHFRHDLPHETVTGWSSLVGRDRLWLAPKLPPEMDVPAGLLALADTFLLDTFHAAGFGGSGKTGDWKKFARHQRLHPGKTWLLAGGLNPDNIGDALKESGARFVDLNSGVESAPGVKDHAKLRLLAERLRACRG